MGNTPKQYLTYQHNVQRYFREHCDKYDGIIIPLSIATSFPSGTYGFVRALCAKDGNKHYAIDPRSALFQKQWNRNNVRDPHRKMAQTLGETFAEVGLTRALTSADFASDEVLKECVRLCVEFQLQFRTREEDQRKLNKYRKLLGLDAGSLHELRAPQFLIPPYFQFDGYTDPWYQISQRCIVFSQEFAAEIPVQPVLHFRQWPDITWKTAFDWLRKTKVDSFWFYPNDFREHTAADSELKAYCDAVESAIDEQLTPNTLFGGYYAILLTYFGLQAFGNGIGYGEWRDSGYHRGGTASTRVYILKLHRYLDAPAAQALIDFDPDYFGSDTEILTEYIEAGKPLDDMSTEDALNHFMQCRKLEIDFVANQSLVDAISELRQTLAVLEPKELERHEYGASLERWANVLEDCAA
jgi:hypothetical protein